ARDAGIKLVRRRIERRRRGLRAVCAAAAGCGGAHANLCLADRQRDGIGMRLLDAGLTEFAGEGLKQLTVEVERDNRNSRRFYERAGFAETRELTRDVQGYVLPLVEYRRPILGSAPLISQPIT